MPLWTRGHDHYEVLLPLIVAVIVMMSFDSIAARSITIALLGLTLTFAFWTSGASMFAVASASALAFVVFIAATVGQVGSGKLPDFAFTTTGVLLCAGAISTVVRSVAAQTRITRRTAAGALSVYLLIGLLFAYVYGLMSAATGRSYFAEPGRHPAVDFVYFSYVSLTTVGYGDLTAASSLGKMVAVVEALLGQLYLVTIVALVVANIGQERSRRNRRDR